MDRPPRFEDHDEDDELDAELLQRRVCDFGLQIEGGPLAPIIARFRAELAASGLVRVQPAFYLTDEWGVPDGSVAIGIPFYLADERLRRLHARSGALVEGVDAEDILRYLRHEMGHVVNYAYRLHEPAEWARLFGPMDRPYLEEFCALPFSPDFVRHLPGHYAQKHPDDDWAETFAVLITPGCDWRRLYHDAPGALAKLEYCARAVAEIAGRDPASAAVDLDTEVGEIEDTVGSFYDADGDGVPDLPASLDGDLAALAAPHAPGPGDAPREALAALVRRHRDHLAAAVYRWTGLDPARGQALLDHLAGRAAALGLACLASERAPVLADLACLATTLALSYRTRLS